jgi:hypothetical protein
MKMSKLCETFLEWAAVNRPAEALRYEQFLRDLLAYRIGPPYSFSGVCRSQPIERATACVRAWWGEFSLEEVRNLNPLAQSFAIDAGEQLLDWAMEAGHEFRYSDLSRQVKANITARVRDLLVRFTVPPGHKFVHREVTKVEPWQEQMVVTQAGESGLAVLTRCHLTGESFTDPPVDGWAETVEGEGVDDYGFAFACRLPYKRDGGVYHCPGLLPGTWITAFQNKGTEVWEAIPAHWTWLFAVKSAAAKKFRRSRRRP